MVAANFRYDHWAKDTIKEEEEIIEAHCFIPNGNYIILHISQYITFSELKEVSLNEIKREQYYYSLRMVFHNSSYCMKIFPRITY